MISLSFSSTNPENYYMTFYEFINRFCQSCTVDISGQRGPGQDYMDSDTKDRQAHRPTSSFGSGFVDENDNEIIF